jgi:dTDP-4-amino-4,6-dideoxygalactose transaminase
MNFYVPFHKPSIGEEEIEEAVAVLKSGWLTTGPRTARFESETAKYVQAPYAQAVNSCTAGLHLALAALNIGPGDEVITTPMTFCATVNSILHVGATPVLADIDETGNIDPKSVAAKITDRTRAILPVHLAGLPVDMEAIWSLAKKHDLAVIEDAAHAIGTHYRGDPIGARSSTSGSASDAVVFSFYATKSLTTGEGGMITTHNEKLAARLKTLCLHGISHDAWNRYGDRGNWYYEVTEAGFKYNLSDVQSAIGIHQLHRQEEQLKVRTRYAEMYNDAFASLDEVECPPNNPQDRHAWHLYILRLNLDKLTIDRASFIEALRNKGISTSVHFIPVTLQPFFRNLPISSDNACPKAERLYQRIVSLPLYPAMSPDAVRYVARSVRRTINDLRRSQVKGASAA